MKKILIAIVCMLGLTWGIANAQTMDVSSNPNDRSVSIDRTTGSTTNVSTPIGTTTNVNATRNTTANITGTATGAVANVNITGTRTTQTTKVPEPATMLLLGLGFLGLAGIRRKLQK